MPCWVPLPPAISAAFFRPATRVQTAIDRALGSAADGQLFETDTQYLDAGCDSLSVYIRSDGYLEQVVACFRALERIGFGKKSSTGLGEFEIAGLTVGRDIFDVWFESGSSWFAVCMKRGLVMLAPGSVFRTSNQTPRPWYGSMISVPRPEMPKALHYGLCFPVPMVWGGEAV